MTNILIIGGLVALVYFVGWLFGFNDRGCGLSSNESDSVWLAHCSSSDSSSSSDGDSGSSDGGGCDGGSCDGGGC